jgi:hypothetical protein|uniref:Uncharacterized protein n=1 Tax=viral metagenome TaxID=1070528 RepID=A0A6C0ILG0_9ZZZZ
MLGILQKLFTMFNKLTGQKFYGLIRGNQQRKYNAKLKDSMDISLLNSCIDSYNTTIRDEKLINKSLKKKKIRLSNFPSHISENIAKFAIANKYGIVPSWDTKKGDLVIEYDHDILQLEVKGSINLNDTLPTYGPTETWDHIYFVDGVHTQEKIYTVYEIKLSNASDTWRNIKVNKSQTFQDQCNEKRRPRLTFSSLQQQLGSHCNIIFQGHIDELSL